MQSSAWRCIFRFQTPRTSIVNAFRMVHNCNANTRINMLATTPIYSKQIGTDNIIFTRQLSTESEKKNTTSSDKEIDISRENPYAKLTMGEKVKEASKTASYSLVIIAGIGVTGVIFYLIGRELFSGQSPMGVYSDALSQCKNCTELSDITGEPMKGFGETTKRGRRKHVSHIEFEEDGKKHMRMKFYVQGPHRRGTVHVEMKQDENNKYQYKYLIVELDGYPPRIVVIHDNR